MDQGHGLVDRLLISTPMAMRPTLTEMEEAKAYISNEVVQDYDEYFTRVSDVDKDTKFSFDANGKTLLRDTMTDFINSYNQDIKEGYAPPKSKSPEIIPRIAVTLHVLNHIMEEVLLGQTPTDPPTTIPHTILEKAIKYVRHLEAQKEIMCQVKQII